jgi:hypothetical protein
MRQLRKRLLQGKLPNLLKTVTDGRPREARWLSKGGQQSHGWGTSGRRGVRQPQRRESGARCTCCEASDFHVDVGH